MLSAGLFELCDLQESYETTFGNRPAQKHAQTLFNRNYYIFFFQYKIKKNNNLGFLARLYTLEQARHVYKYIF